MNALSGRPAELAALETASLRADFQARLQALREAAQAWGIQPNHPEGIFVSTMIGTQSGFAELALSLAEALNNIVQNVRASAEDELAKQRVVTERTRQTLAKANGVIENLDRGARRAIEQIEVDKTKVLTQLVKDILPDMTRGVQVRAGQLLDNGLATRVICERLGRTERWLASVKQTREVARTARDVQD
jgi:hypothetical protein